MNEAEINLIEEQLSITLPMSYKELLCPFPFKAYAGNTDTDLWDNPSAIIELNQDLHNRGKWPADLFALGKCDAGDSYAIDLESDSEQVIWVDRHIEAIGTGPLDQSFSDWATTLFESMRNGEYADGFDPENDSPEAREKISQATPKEILGCVCVILVIVVVGALLIFGIMVLLGY